MQDILHITKYLVELEPLASLTRIHNYLYYCQSEYLHQTSTQLFENKIIAWQYGMLVPDLYEKQLKEEDYLPNTSYTPCGLVKNVLDYVVSNYFHLSAHWLAVLATKEYSWKIARRAFWKTPVVTPKLMTKYYKKIRH